MIYDIVFTLSGSLALDFIVKCINELYDKAKTEREKGILLIMGLGAIGFVLYSIVKILTGGLR